MLRNDKKISACGLFIPEPSKVFSSTNENSLYDIRITEEIVLEKLSKLDVNKSIGPDEIHGKLLFELRFELVKPLTKLFNLSIRLGSVPQDWRDANVVPLFKKGSRSKAQNYRPVSLTSVVGKLLESIRLLRIM